MAADPWKSLLDGRFPVLELTFAERVRAMAGLAYIQAPLPPDLLRRYQTLLEVGEVIHSKQRPEELFKSLAGLLRRVLSFDGISISLLEPDHKSVRIALLESFVTQQVGVGFVVPLNEVPAAWVIEHQKPLRVLVRDDDPRFALHNHTLKGSGLAASIHLPLTSSLSRLGELVLVFANEVEVTPEEIQFMQRVADQVALAIENATNYDKVQRTQRELEYRNAQRELLLQLTNSIVSHLSLRDALRAVVSNVRRVVACDIAVVTLPDGAGNLRFEAMEFPNSKGYFYEGLSVPIGGSMAGRVFTSGTAIVVNQLSETSYSAEMFQKITAEGIKTQCFIPFVSGGQSLGVLSLSRTEYLEFSADDIEYLGLVAAQITIALENSFNYERARSAERQRKKERDRLQLLMDVTNHLSSSLELPELLQAIVKKVRQLMQCDIVTIHLPDQDRTNLKPVAMDFPDGRLVLQDAPGVPIQINTAFANKAVGRLHQEAFLSGKPLVAARIDPVEYPVEAEFLAQEGIVGGCVIPMIHRGKVVGNLGLGRKEEKEFSPDEVDFLCQFGSQVGMAIENALVYREIGLLKEKLSQEKLYLEDEIRSQINFQEIVGESPVLRSVLQRVHTVASSDATVLILGETGTGKELIARAIHEASKRKGRTFVKLNCAAIPTGLLESELFGHERGAFTGAIAQKIGRMELANGGTLFLDEVGDIPLELQPKLLRALQEREFERLGSTRTQRVDVRILAATHRDLKKMVDEKEFRSDLFYRLNVFPVTLPPLRQRRDDIPRLVRYFVAKYARKMDKQIETIPTEAMLKLQNWSWPGNVRELENIVERSVILTQGAALYVPIAELETAMVDVAPENRLLRDTERDHIAKILRECNWVLSGPNGAAARLGVKRTTLQYKIKKLGITRLDA